MAAPSPSPRPSPLGGGGIVPALENFRTQQTFERSLAGFPLPEGEGWGEGERDVFRPVAPAFQQLNSAAHGSCSRKNCCSAETGFVTWNRPFWSKAFVATRDQLEK